MLPVRAINDGEIEGDEDVVATLADDPSYELAAPTEATVIIQEDDRLTDDPHFCECTCTCNDLLIKIQEQVGAVATKFASAIVNPLGGVLHLVGLSSSNPHPVISVDTSFTHEALDATVIEAQLTLGGVTGPPVYYDPATITPGEQYRFSLQADATTLDTGLYDWAMKISEHHVEGGNPYEVTRTFNGRVKVNNLIDSPLGNRWAIREWDRLTVTGRIAVALFAELWLYRFWE